MLLRKPLEKCRDETSWNKNLGGNLQTFFHHNIGALKNFILEYRCGELAICIKVEKDNSGVYNCSVTCCDGIYELQTTLNENY